MELGSRYVDHPQSGSGKYFSFWAGRPTPFLGNPPILFSWLRVPNLKDSEAVKYSFFTP